MIIVGFIFNYCTFPAVNSVSSHLGAKIPEPTDPGATPSFDTDAFLPSSLDTTQSRHPISSVGKEMNARVERDIVQPLGYPGPLSGGTITNRGDRIVDSPDSNSSPRPDCSAPAVPQSSVAPFISAPSVTSAPSSTSLHQTSTPREDVEPLPPVLDHVITMPKSFMDVVYENEAAEDSSTFMSFSNGQPHFQSMYPCVFFCYALEANSFAQIIPPNPMLLLF